MGSLGKLVHDIGYEVDKLLSTVQDEHTKIKELNSKMAAVDGDILNLQSLNVKHKEEIQRLETQLFREMQHTANLTSTSNLLVQREEALERALADLKKTNDRVREERMKVVQEFTTKMDSYKLYIEHNTLLKSFLDLWKEKSQQQMEIMALPELILDYVKSLPEEIVEPTLLTNMKMACAERTNEEETMSTSRPQVEKRCRSSDPASPKDLDSSAAESKRRRSDFQEGSETVDQDAPVEVVENCEQQSTTDKPISDEVGEVTINMPPISDGDDVAVKQPISETPEVTVDDSTLECRDGVTFGSAEVCTGGQESPSINKSNSEGSPQNELETF